jgi:tRNA (guanine-N7-)-methyltransferase
MDWSLHYPAYAQVDATAQGIRPINRPVEIADIGCGFGGLLVALSPLLPETLMIGPLLPAVLLGCY